MATMTHTRLFLVVALTIALLSPEAAGQEAGVDRTAVARALFQEGLELLDTEQWEEAADRFQRALALRPSPQIAYNLTTALIPLGHLVRASELLRQVTRDPTVSAEVRQAAETRRQEVIARLARLIVELDGELVGTQVFVDERPLDTAAVGVALPVDPGSHTVSARRGDREVALREIDLDEAEERVVLLEPAVPADPDESDQVAVVPTPGEGSGDEGRSGSGGIHRQWWFWTIIGVVVVGGAVTAGVLGSRDRTEWPNGAAGATHTIYLGD